jgi:hypothetical protein
MPYSPQRKECRGAASGSSASKWCSSSAGKRSPEIKTKHSVILALNINFTNEALHGHITNNNTNERERERQTEAKRETNRGKERDKQRQRERQIERQRDGQRERQRERET